MTTSQVLQGSSSGTVVFLMVFTILQAGDDMARAANEIKSSPCEISPGQNVLRAEQEVDSLHGRLAATLQDENALSSGGRGLDDVGDPWYL